MSRRHPSSSLVYTKYLQLKNAVSIPEKTLICLIRGRMQFVGDNDVFIVHARKHEIVRMM